MDTNRISIIGRDLSEGATPRTETLKGFTVVKAPKGPIDPVLIPAGNPSLVYEVLGYTSKEYPQIQEVLDFNKQFDVYVSAPYSQSVEGLSVTSIPVAYVTPAGIFPAAEVVSLEGANLSNVKGGEEDVDGISKFTSDPAVLVPVGIEASLFGSSDLAEDDATPLTFSNDTLTIGFGFDIGLALTDSPTGIDVLDSTEFSPTDVGRILRMGAATANIEGELVFDIPGEELIVLRIKDDAGNFSLVTEAGTELCAINPVSGDTVLDIVKNNLETTGDALIDRYFTTSSFSQIWGSTEFLSTVHVYWRATLNQDFIKATIFPKYVSERTLSFTVARQTLGNRISFTVSEQVTPTTYSTKNITGSLLGDDVDGFGASLSFDERLANQHLVEVVVIDTFDETTVYSATRTSVAPILPATSFRLARGTRIVDDAAIEAAWSNVASDPDYEHVEVFFRPDELAVSAESSFFDLAATHKLSRFVTSMVVAPEDATTTMPQLSKGYNYFVITNSFLRRSTFTREDYWSPLTGAAAAMYLACVAQKMGGVAPMYLNSNGLGGQLNVAVKKPRYKFNKDQLTNLDNANFNPIIRDQAYGVMLVGQKTARGGELSDWSYIGHASAFLRLLREVRDNVMIPQLGKPNNTFYRELRQEQISMMLRPRTTGDTRIWAEAIADTSRAVNTDDVLRERNFAMVIKVKVDIFSEGVELTLINYPQGTEIV
jgi:hypothetical protein